MLKKYNLVNNVFGWLSFLIAAIVYLLTIEPTASFWDCGEFISSVYKLEVGHPPGAPFFMLTGKFFTLFASNPSQVAAMVNAMSALLSAATILFLFWTTTHLARKLIYTDEGKDMSLGQMIVIIGCGLIGSLTYTFTDTFWFSAVEGEVYAYSSMFTALVFWLILKWENRASQPGSDKWLVVIAYAMGLSIGVHLLNLLCIPAIVLVYYFKKQENPTLKGTLLTLALSFVMIVVLMYGIIPGFTKVGGWFELFFVNDLGFSYNTGVLTYIVLLLISIVWGLYETIANKGSLLKAKIAFFIAIALCGVPFIGDSGWLWLLLFVACVVGVFYYKGMTMRVVNTSVLCLLVVLVGYSSFALIPIRSIANTPMDQNSPENVFTLASYLNREQYGDRPLIYGKTYASEEERDDEGEVIYSGVTVSWDKVVKTDPNQKDEYVIVRETPKYGYTNSMLLPRMHSSGEQRHLNGFAYWADVDDFKTPPTYFQNLKFFLNYQLNHMYFRYFMWNFAGRQNDIQGNGEISNGNWITGIKWFDEHILGRGPQDNLPPSITENKGHNVFYGIPFLLGILGILYQFRKKEKGERQFLITFMLFFMTGIAIILYLNQQPQEPRERDYAYAGSFYAYCIWIGLGVAMLWELLKKKLDEKISAIIVSVACLFVPIQMASQTWDDHDRSGRYTMRDFGQNYLVGLPQDAIVFTMGDNDTFPLWYAQEVEGYRTDVRVCNLMYLQTDWYIDQMRRGAYESSPLPISWTADQYTGMRGYYAHLIAPEQVNNYAKRVFEYEKSKGYAPANATFKPSNYYDTDAFVDTMSLADAMEILKTKEKYIPDNPFGLEKGVLIPSTKFVAKVDTGMVDWVTLGTTASDELLLDLSKKNGIYRSDIMVMEMLNSINENNWERPIYYAMTIGEPPLNLQNHAQLEGINFRIVPGTPNDLRMNLDITFDNVMNKYKWGGVNNPKVYLDENNQRLAKSFRFVFRELIDGLMATGDSVRALQALDKCMEVLPGTTLPRGQESISFISNYFNLGEKEKAEQVAKELLHYTDGQLQWYSSMKLPQMYSMSADISEQLLYELMVVNLLQENNSDLFREYYSKSNKYMDTFLSNGIKFDNRRHPAIISMNIAENAFMNKVADQDSIQLLDIAQMALDKDSDFIALSNIYTTIASLDKNASSMFQFPEVMYLQLLSIDDKKLTPKQQEDKKAIISKMEGLK